MSFYSLSHRVTAWAWMQCWLSTRWWLTTCLRLAVIACIFTWLWFAAWWWIATSCWSVAWHVLTSQWWSLLASHEPQRCKSSVRPSTASQHWNPSDDDPLSYEQACQLPGNLLMQIISWSGLVEPFCHSWLTPYKAMLADPQQMAIWLSMSCGSQDKALRCAARHGKYGVVRALLDSGADVHSKGVLVSAAYCGHCDIVRLLLDRGADGTVTLSEALVVAANQGHLAVVRLLLGRSSEAVTVSPGMSDALSDAARNGRVEVVRLLLDAGAHAHASKLGKPLTRAVIGGHLEAVLLLLSHDGGTSRVPGEALYMAIECGHTHIVKALLDQGAEIHDLNGMALRIAVSSGHVQVVRLLLDRGAVIDEHVVRVAVAAGQTEVLRLLQEHAAHNP